MNMKWVRITVKWELRKWCMFAWVFGVVAVLWAVLAFLPVPQAHWYGHWYGTLKMIVPGVLILAGTITVFSGLMMMFVYPFLASFSDLYKTALPEHQTGCPYAYRLFTRLGLNVITYLLGVGILWMTMLLLRRFEAFVDAQWFSNMLDDSPVILLPMVSMFPLGAPLTVLVAYKFLGTVLCGQKDFTGWDNLGLLAATSLTGLYPLMERMFDRLPFAPALVIYSAVSLLLSIVAALLISRYIDRFSGVAA